MTALVGFLIGFPVGAVFGIIVLAFLQANERDVQKPRDKHKRFPW